MTWYGLISGVLYLASAVLVESGIRLLRKVENQGNSRNGISLFRMEKTSRLVRLDDIDIFAIPSKSLFSAGYNLHFTLPLGSYSGDFLYAVFDRDRPNEGSREHSFF